MRARGFAVVALTAAVVVTGFTVGHADAGDEASTETDRNIDLLTKARQRTVAHEYSGVILVQWRDAGGTNHEASTRVRYDNGVIEMGTNGHVVTADPNGLALPGAPRVDDKYDVTRAAGPDIAHRATTMFSAQRDRDGVLVERFYIDDLTGLVLRHESFDGNGTSRQSLQFTRVWANADGSGLTAARQVETPAQDERLVSSVDLPYRAPGRAGDGFRLVARRRHSGAVVQLSYSDGLLSASVFEQPGRLNWNALPDGGQPANVGGHPAVAYAMSVGSALVWEHAGIVYTCVADAPKEELLALAAGVSSHGQDGTATRLARVVLAPFAW
jgi:sigma-E factor negative regulatory protein RseB